MFSIFTKITVIMIFSIMVQPQQKAGRVALPDPDEGVVELWVDGLQVLQEQLLVEHALVEGQREARVDELAVEQRLARGNARR